MRSRAVPALLLGILLLPTASAWRADLVSAPSAASLRESLLVAGALNATVENGVLGSPHALRLSFDGPVTVKMCPDQAGAPQQEANCAGNVTSTGARFYVHDGGVIVSAPKAEITMASAATAAALGGPNVTLNDINVGPGVYAGGDVIAAASSAEVAIRPLGSQTSLEIRGDQGFRTYNGTAYTFYVSGANTTRLEGVGTFIGGSSPRATLTRAPLANAESAIRVNDLFDLLRAIQPPETADRRADVPEAFGPFQLVPALLNGAAAARTNLTLNGAARDDFTFLRLDDLAMATDGANWTASGNASYIVEGAFVAAEPGGSTKFPVVVPVLLILAAIAARIFTTREHPPRRRRALALLTRALGALFLLALAATLLAPLIGFSPILDARALSFRSGVQLALLLVGMVVSAYVAVGWPVESLVRSAFAWRERPHAVIWPAIAGIVGAAVFLAISSELLLSFVARFVRL